MGKGDQNWNSNESISGFSVGHLRSPGDYFGAKIHEKKFRNRRQNGPKSRPGGSLGSSRPPSRSRRLPGWLQGRSWAPQGASWVAFAAPNGAMLCARCAPRGLRKRKKIGMKIGSFSHGPRRSVFLTIWWFWVVKRVDFECQSGAKLAFKLKTCKRLPALRFL